MLTSPSNGRRLAGQAVVALIAATALPLTASWATVYVDVAASAPPITAAAAQLAATPQPATLAPTAAAAMTAAPTSAAAPAASYRTNQDGTITLAGGVRLDRGSTAFFANDTVLINGQVKPLEQLSPAERAQLRAVIVKSQAGTARERARLPQELVQMRREAERARSGELRREILRDREDLRRDLAEIDREADELRANGEDPEKRKAEMLRDLREAEAVDIDKQIREAIAEADPAKRIAELRADEQQMARMLAKLDQLDQLEQR